MNMHSLVVDDSGIMRKMVMRALREAKLAQFIFTEAADGVEALEKFDPKTIHIIFVDWNMPNMTGLDLLKAVRGDDGLKGIPFIMVTAEGLKENVLEAVKLGVTNYVVKPFTPEAFTEKIQAALN